eukprot:Em0008g1187a
MAVPAVEPHSGDQEQCGKLLQAVTNGDSLVVRSLLKAQNDLVRHTDLNGNTLLHIACEQKQFKVIGELVRAGVNVRERNSSGDTALHIAAGSTSKGKVIRLLSTEDTLNSKGSGGRTPLHRACQAGMLEAAKELVVELKCDVTATDDEGRTGLHVASAGGYLEIVKHLLAADLVQLKDACGYTALHYACEGGHDKIVKLLCKSDADIAVRNSNNETPLDVAALNGWNKVVDCILSKGRCCKDITGVKGRSALHHACAQGHVRLAEELIKKHQCNICAGDDNEMTPLHLASANGTEVIVELLASTSNSTSTSTVNSVDSLGWAAVHHACQNGHVGALRTLIRFGAELNIQNKDGQLPLHLAAFNGHVAIIDTLVFDYECDIRQEDSKGRTCFHHACTGGCETAVKTLVEKHRFDPKEKDGHGVSPIQMAALHGKSNIVTLLESTYGCSFMESPSHFLAALLQYSCQEGSISMLKLALKIGADPNQRIRPQGGSALHYACEHGHPLVIEHLTSLYLCDVNKGDDNSCTPLHVASSCGHVEAVRELGRCAGLLVDSAEKAGLTPLHYACYKGHTRVVKALIELGANLQVCSLRKGWSILHSAAYGGQEDVMNMLINEYNCDPRAVDKRGRLPFHTACIAGHVKLVRVLVQNLEDPTNTGANMNALVTGGNGLLHLAALNGHSRVVKFLVEEFKRNKLSLVQMLLQFGAATDITANDGSMPLIHAVQQGYQDIFEVLVGKCKPTEIFNSFKSLESRKKELEDQLQRSKYQLLECEEKWKVQEKVDRRRSSDDVYKIKQEMAALRDQRKLGNDIISERCSTGFPVKSLSSEADLALVVNELANKVPLQWKEVCSKLGTTLKCLQDIEREGMQSLGCDDIATSLHNDSQQRSTNNDSVEQSLPVHFSPRSSFEPVTSLASCGRNSAFLSEGTAAPEDQAWFGAIIEETVTFSTSPS